MNTTTTANQNAIVPHVIYVGQSEKANVPPRSTGVAVVARRFSSSLQGNVTDVQFKEVVLTALAAPVVEEAPRKSAAEISANRKALIAGLRKIARECESEREMKLRASKIFPDVKVNIAYCGSEFMGMAYTPEQHGAVSF